MIRAALLTSWAGSAAAWGPDGHTVVAHIAEKFLTPEADADLKKDLGNVTLSQASDWNDDFDHTAEGRWSEALHFINYPGHACNFDWARDCKNDWCNPGAIVNYTSQIFDKSLSADRRLVALKFVIHMMGDLHQPLHVASADDLGGNTIKVAGNEFSPSSEHWVHRSETLHSQWDSSIVVQAIYDLQNGNKTDTAGPRALGSFPVHYHNWSLLSDELEKRMEGNWSGQLKEWQQAIADPRDQADFRAGLAKIGTESAGLGCKYAYSYADGERVQTGDMLHRDYYLRARPVVEEQLAKGGARLAQALNDAFEIMRAKGNSYRVLMI